MKKDSSRCCRSDGENVDKAASGIPHDYPTCDIGHGGFSCRWLTYFAFPDSQWIKLRTNNPLERIMREIRRLTRVVGAFPDQQSFLNQAAARLRHIAGTNWSTRRYMNMDPINAMKNKIEEPMSRDQKCERSWTLPKKFTKGVQTQTLPKKPRRPNDSPQIIETISPSQCCCVDKQPKICPTVIISTSSNRANE